MLYFESEIELKFYNPRAWSVIVAFSGHNYFYLNMETLICKIV